MLNYKRFWLVAFFLFPALLFLFACSSATVTAEVGIITGTVYAADGVTPIAGASVYLQSDSSKSTTTNTDGEFTIEGDWITTGTHTLVASIGDFSITFTVPVTGDGATTDAGSQEVDPADPNVSVPDLGVVMGSYDSIQNIIADLGYSFTTIEVADVNSNYAFISTFEAIFINCGFDSYSFTSSGETNLQNFVESTGSSLYVSDWAAEAIDGIWEDAIVWYGGSVENAQVGNHQTLEVTVDDSTLQTVLGKTTAEVYYDLGSWVMISSEGTSTTVLLSGDPTVSTVYALGSEDRLSASSTVAGTLESVPLAVKFQPAGSSKGTVIYTTFHNEAQEEDVTEDARKILQDFIFRL